MRELFDGLRDRDYRRENLMVLEGKFVIHKALDLGFSPTALLCLPPELNLWRSRVPASCDVFSLDAGGMETLLGYRFHRGALALASRPEIYTPSSKLIPPGPLLCLWQVSDPDNLGALVRSAAALGASAVVLGPGCADPFSRKAMRSSMGCVLSVPLYRVEDVEGLVSICTRERPLVAAALSPAALEPEGLPAQCPCLVLGNEGFGLPLSVLEACPYHVMLPMQNAVDSLNVGAAGAILMWELFHKKAGSS